MDGSKAKLENTYTAKDVVFCFVINTNKNIPNDIIQIIFVYYLIKDTWIYTIGNNGCGQLGSGDCKRITKLKVQNHQNKYIQNIYQSADHTIYSDDDHNNIWVSGLNAFGQCAINNRNHRDRKIKNLAKIQSFDDKNIKIKNIFTNNSAYHTFWMDINDNIYTNGWNQYHQLGLKDDNQNKVEPTEIKYLKNVKDIQLSRCHTLVLDDNGHVYASGYGRYGENGLGEFKTIKEFTIIPSLKKHKIIKIKNGYQHSLFLSETGNVFSCGGNACGQLGLGIFSINNVSIPTMIEYFNKNNIKIINMDCGGLHNLVLDTNGKIYSFGFNMNGQCGNGTGTDILTPTIINTFKDIEIKRIGSGMFHSYAMTSSDKHYLWGSNEYNECITNDNTVEVLNPHYINDIITKETNKKIRNISLGHCNTIIVVE